jgi:non-specific protein-tyrosine kinase
MKLRQALEKAQQLRGGSPPPEPRPDAPPPPRRPVARLVGTDWKPPAYAESGRVALDPARLAANRCVCFRTDCDELEYYKVLRTKLQFQLRSRGWRTLMVTSPNVGEGKTLTAVNLALTFAKAFNQTVMLVDADLRRPQVHRTLGFEASAGLVDHLVADRPLKEFIVWPEIEQMTVLPAGRAVANSAELLGSARMRAVVEELKTRYEDRTVIFDTGPVLDGADALALAAHVDGFVLVLAERQTGMRAVKRSLDMLPREKFLGFVLNRQRNPKAKAYY